MSQSEKTRDPQVVRQEVQETQQDLAEAVEHVAYHKTHFKEEVTESIKAQATDAVDQLKENVASHFKDSASAKPGELKDAVVEKATDLKDTAVEKKDELMAAASEKKDDVMQAASEKKEDLTASKPSQDETFVPESQGGIAGAKDKMAETIGNVTEGVKTKVSEAVHGHPASEG
ncbi:MAG TPA: hypothetical protein VEU28_04865 [Actinomycetota bacterium]|nr:hypothetical protein [Actinomycetota bacterium]